MIQKLLPFLTLIALFVGLSIASPNFLTATNLSSVVRQTAVINIMALGMTLVIIAGGIDLSVGSILGVSGLVGAMAMEHHAPILVGIAVGIAVGMACGIANGSMIIGLRINPFIVTLGTMGIFRGLALIISNGLPVHDIPRSFSYLGEGTLLGVPFVLWILTGLRGGDAHTAGAYAAWAAGVLDRQQSRRGLLCRSAGDIQYDLRLRDCGSADGTRRND